MPVRYPFDTVRVPLSYSGNPGVKQRVSQGFVAGYLSGVHHVEVYRVGSGSGHSRGYALNLPDRPGGAVRRADLPAQLHVTPSKLSIHP